MNAAQDKKTLYRVTASPFSEDGDFPWDYEEDGFISWVDEVFFEGYKQRNDAPFPSASECLDKLRGLGYTVEVVEDNPYSIA